MRVPWLLGVVSPCRTQGVAVMSDKKNESRDTSDRLPEHPNAAHWRKVWGLENSPIRIVERPPGERDESVVIIRGFKNPFVKGDPGVSGESGGSGGSDG